MAIFLNYVLLGLVQGITEWLPISSDGHLFIAHRLLNIPEDLALDVFLHGASLLVLLIYFRQPIIDLLKGIIARNKADLLYAWFIILTTIATVTVALILEPWISVWQSNKAVALFFFITGIFVLSTRWTVHNNANKQLTWPKAVVLGLGQGAAVLTGWSRSATMLGLGLGFGLSKELAFRYTFIAAIPAIAGAFLREVPKLEIQPLHWVAFVVTLVSGYAALKLLDVLVRREQIFYFGIYAIILAGILFFL
jgi:undecaprenyl-diphosphatase